jgi:hypothetical protein
METLTVLVRSLALLLSGGQQHKRVGPDYWTISFKSTWGVTRDPFYLFDISATAEFLRDTSKISAFESKFLSFLPFFFFRQFGPV